MRPATFLPAAVLVLALLPACDRRGRPGAPPAPASRPAATQPATQPAAALRPDDFDVLRAALAHLAAHAEFPTVPAMEKKRVVVLHRVTAGPSGYLAAHQIQSDLRDHSVPSDALADLELRNSGIRQTPAMDVALPDKPGTPLDGLAPTAPNVVVADLDKLPPGDSLGLRGPYETFATTYPQAKGYVNAWLPGYSTNGRRAVVRFLCGPTPHGASATCLLEKDAGGRWNVLWCDFAVYA